MTRKPIRTQIPVPGGSGLTPTGAMEFQQDWPGLFVRGDNAVQLSTAIRRLQHHCSDHDHWEVSVSLDVLGEIAGIIELDVVVRADENGKLFVASSPYNMLFTLGLRHTFHVWRRGLALVQFPVVQTSLASFRSVS
ncbi:MAG: hypothetical protein Aurels2KO_39630 [Aureliella sp.]